MVVAVVALGVWLLLCFLSYFVVEPLYRELGRLAVYPSNSMLNQLLRRSSGEGLLKTILFPKFWYGGGSMQLPRVNREPCV